MTLNITVEKLPTTQRDAEEFMISTEYRNERYVSFIDITGIRSAIEGHNIRPLIERGKKLFSEDIRSGKIKSSDRIKYCFWSDGDFIIYPKSNEVNIKARVSKYAGDRLHIEIRKEYRALFNEGNEVTIIKK